MKSLFFPIVFVFCFAIMLAGTKAVPTGETPSIGRSQNKACHGRPLPSAARPQKPIYAIDWHFFRTLGWKQIRYFPSCSYRIRFALPKERKDYIGLRIHWSNPCRFNSCRPHHIKTKASGFLERMSGGFFLWLRLAKKQARDITSNSRKSCLII